MGGEKGIQPRIAPLGVPLALAALSAGVSPVLATGGSAERSTAPGNNQSKIESRVLQDTAAGQKASFVIYLRDQADLSAAYGMRNQDARGRYVYKTLKAYAARTQAGIRALLAARDASYRPFWVANVIVARGDRSLVEALAERSDVESIESNDASNWLQGEERRSAGSSAAPETIEPGVIQVHAPAMWALGYTGQGIVIGNQDTGMRWTHNALKPHYRSWNGTSADHNYNWHDSIHSGGGICSPNHIGVAPGAKWIGGRNMDRGNGTPATYTECFQFFIAPTDLNGQNPDPTLRPHVMNNSWGCPPSEGCAPDTLQTIVENTEAAGIFVEASAGNSGPNCSTVDTPPAHYTAAFATGAISSSTTALASFSSRGPVTIDGSGRIKPEIVAPGVNVRSSVNTGDSAYQGAGWSGTSMAGPHVVGVVALLWSARPDLARNIAATKQLLGSTANPAVSVPNNGGGCGGIDHVPNNHFGWGLVDALAAYNGAPDLIGTVGPGFEIYLRDPNGQDVTTDRKSV